MSGITNAQRRSVEGYKAETNSRGEKVIIPMSLLKTTRSLKQFADNQVLAGAFVAPAWYGASANLGAYSVASGVIRQAGYLRSVSGVASVAVPYVGTQSRVTVYLPPITSTTGATVNGHFVPSPIVAPTAMAVASTTLAEPAPPDGSLVLAHIYYAGATTQGTTISAVDIDNDARPKLYSPEGVWYR